MKAAFLTGIRQLQILDTPEPELMTPHDVLLRIDTVGVCGSDVHYYTGSAFGDFLLGLPNTSFIVENSPNTNEGAVHWGLYGQDTWQVTRNLTVNFGLRWELNPKFSEATGDIANFLPIKGGPSPQEVEEKVGLLWAGSQRTGRLALARHLSLDFCRVWQATPIRPRATLAAF